LAEVDRQTLARELVEQPQGPEALIVIRLYRLFRVR
jgi:hypothetical protein